jgi:hypothetical protein
MTAAEQLHGEGFLEGFLEGFQEGQRENLLRLLDRWFGPLPELVLDRIGRAEPAQLERWFARGIMAQSLDAVFADEP